MPKQAKSIWTEPGGLLLIESLAFSGCSEAEIAERCGMSPEEFSALKNRDPRIREALRFTAEAADLLVQKALLKKATGYEYEELTWEFKQDKTTGEGEMQLIKRLQRHSPPDLPSITFWLKHRQPGTWRDDASHSSAQNGGVVLISKTIGDTAAAIAVQSPQEGGECT